MILIRDTQGRKKEKKKKYYVLQFFKSVKKIDEFFFIIFFIHLKKMQFTDGNFCALVWTSSSWLKS